MIWQVLHCVAFLGLEEHVRGAREPSNFVSLPDVVIDASPEDWQGKGPGSLRRHDPKHPSVVRGFLARALQG